MRSRMKARASGPASRRCRRYALRGTAISGRSPDASAPGYDAPGAPCLRCLEPYSSKPSCTREKAMECSVTRSSTSRLRPRIQRVVGGAHIGEFAYCRLTRHDPCRQQRINGAGSAERGVGVPQPVAQHCTCADLSSRARSAAARLSGSRCRRSPTAAAGVSGLVICRR